MSTKYKGGGTGLDKEKLEAKLLASGYSKSEIAGRLGITRQGLYNKLSGEREFKSSEIKALAEMLNLTAAERDHIFFGDFVDENANNLQASEESIIH